MGAFGRLGGSVKRASRPPTAWRVLDLVGNQIGTVEARSKRAARARAMLDFRRMDLEVERAENSSPVGALHHPIRLEDQDRVGASRMRPDVVEVERLRPPPDVGRLEAADGTPARDGTPVPASRSMAKGARS